MLATFLGKVGGIFFGCFPDYGQTLKQRLAKPDVTRTRIQAYQERNRIALKAVSEIVELMDVDPGNRVDNTLRKKEMLILLLGQTEQELDDFAGQGMQFPSSSREIEKVVREERILTRLLKATIKERTMIENEQKLESPKVARKIADETTGGHWRLRKAVKRKI